MKGRQATEVRSETEGDLPERKRRPGPGRSPGRDCFGLERV